MSVAANYRSVWRPRSHDEFINKLGVAEGESDETMLWLEFIADSNIVNRKRVRDLLQEVNELTAILAASRITAIRNRNHRTSQIGNRK